MAFDLHSGMIGKLSLMTSCYQVGASGGISVKPDTNDSHRGWESQCIVSQSHSHNFRYSWSLLQMISGGAAVENVFDELARVVLKL